MRWYLALVSKADFPHNERRTTLPCSPLVPRPAFDFLGSDMSNYDLARLLARYRFQTRLVMQKYRAFPLTEAESRLSWGDR